MKQAGVQKREGVSIYDISFASPVDHRSTSVGPTGGVVTAYLVVPPGSGPFPAVIYGHWCMPGSDKKNRTEFLDEAIVLAHSGVIALLPDHVIIHPAPLARTSAADRDPLVGRRKVDSTVCLQETSENGSKRCAECGRCCRS